MSEAALTWSVALAIAAGIWLPYYVRFRRRITVDAARKEEATALRIDRPIAQYPYVDPFRCAGCATCIEACPEGDVLGIVGGTAVIINGFRCIGIGECETACPVEAIEVGLGDLRSRDDVPLLDEHLQTNLPGVFVAGELGGLSLVSNAVREGRKVADYVAIEVSTEGPAAAGIHDLAIVGAGPAGLSAALAAKAAGLSYLVFERAKGLGGTVLNYPRRKMVLTQPVELPPWGRLANSAYEKEELLGLFENLVEESGLSIQFDASVRTIAAEGDLYRIETSKGTYSARRVLLALGRRGRPRTLGVPGEEHAKVTYKLIDADSYSACSILVVGGGDSAVEAAIALARSGTNRVALSYRKDRLVRVKQRNHELVERLISDGAIHPLFGTQVRKINSRTVELQSGDNVLKLENDYVLVCIGGVPPFRLLREIGVQFGGTEATCD